DRRKDRKKEKEKLDKLSWRESWEDFLYKYKRYDNEKYRNIFGKFSPVVTLAEDRVDGKENAWRVYGEFLRIYHPRLAHDVAESGFPGNETINLFENCFADKKEKYRRDLIGLVARSHGMPLRDPRIQDYLDSFPLTTSPPVTMVQGIPVFYLMAILRLADYLHAGTARAPEERDKAQRIASPVSRNEYAWNQAVYDRMIWHIRRGKIDALAGISDTKHSDDLEIQADPEDSVTYLKLEDWIHAVQNEIDGCWAVLAEKYDTPYPLSIHWLTSNIFKDSEIKRFNGQFLTRPARLTANPDIAKLLVEPLYGSDPSFGVRELLQNAVDACNERVEWTRRENIRREKEDKKPLDCPEGYIRIDVDTQSENKTLTIRDNGIGMSADNLLNYYLVAGASYRDSSAWREAYLGEDNKPTVMRSGRFGVGALATFLLGDSVTVTTRYAGDERGLRFTYGLADTKLLNVESVDGAEVGTTIVVQLNSNSIAYFENTPFDADVYGDVYYTMVSEPVWWYHWYYLNKPRITYSLNERSIGAKPSMFIPNETFDEKESRDWHKVVLSNGVTCFWSLLSSLSDIILLDQSETYTVHAKVFCNGILISSDSEKICREIFKPYGLHICVTLYDKEGLLPISLNRTDIDYIKEFDELFLDVNRYLYARCVLCPEVNIGDIWIHVSGEQKMITDMILDTQLAFFFSEKGFLPLDQEFLSLCVKDRIGCLFLYPFDYEYDDIATITAAIALSKDKGKPLVIVDINMDDEIPVTLQVEGAVFSIKSEPESLDDPDGRKQMYAEYMRDEEYSKNKKATWETSLFHKMIEELLAEHNTELFSDDYWIPYELEDRKRKFPKAFAALEKYRPTEQ
ncbi:MAG: ATP-binding protein, partial [Clostridiales bacterium]|nr:ATP-binding protein [Clostridiales bacterium]